MQLTCINGVFLAVGHVTYSSLVHVSLASNQFVQPSLTPLLEIASDYGIAAYYFFRVTVYGLCDSPVVLTISVFGLFILITSGVSPSIHYRYSPVIDPDIGLSFVKKSRLKIF